MEVFVPGRLCIMGEHSDWAGEYRTQNLSVATGMTIVCATVEGLHAKCDALPLKDGKPTLRFIHKQPHSAAEHIDLEVSLDFDELVSLASEGSFFSYIAGTASVVLKAHREVIAAAGHGIQIDNYKTSLPMKKGLSSSAAVCVLIVKCFAAVYDLNLDMTQVMEYAYLGEMKTPSRCGRMDQCVAMGAGKIGLMTFNSGDCRLRTLHNERTLYFVVADLKAIPSKNTVTILRDLNECFPIAQNSVQYGVHSYITENQAICWEAVEAIENGDVESLSSAMNTAQTVFDKYMMPVCPSELTSPKLHTVINCKELRAVALAVKGVGSQGDGSVQVLCSGPEEQAQVLHILREQFGCDAFLLTVPSSNSSAPIPKLSAFRPTSALILSDHRLNTGFPLLGHNSHLCLLPIPVCAHTRTALLALIQELLAEGIDRIAIVVSSQNDSSYEDVGGKSSRYTDALRLAMSQDVSEEEWNHLVPDWEILRNRVQIFLGSQDGRSMALAQAVSFLSVSSRSKYSLLFRAEALPMRCFSSALTDMIQRLPVLCSESRTEILLFAAESSSAVSPRPLTVLYSDNFIMHKNGFLASELSDPLSFGGFAILPLHLLLDSVNTLTTHASSNGDLHPADSLFQNALNLLSSAIRPTDCTVTHHFTGMKVAAMIFDLISSVRDEKSYRKICSKLLQDQELTCER